VNEKRLEELRRNRNRSYNALGTIIGNARWLESEAVADRLELDGLEEILEAEAERLSTLVEKIQDGEV
jgi:hypothetical protein